jgi:hypothetical protein
MRGPRRPEPHTLAGAYALDAIDGPDRARFERHLARCQACAAELRELREATARLAGAVAADPPAGLVARAVAAAARTRQLPPVTGRARAWPSAGQVRTWLSPGRARPASGRPRRTAARRIALGLAALSLAAAVGSGGVALTAEHHLGVARLSDHAITEVLNAPDAVILTSRVEGGGTATVVMSRRDRSLVFTTAGLPALSAGRCYQLWLMGPAGDRPVDVLPAPDQGMTSPVIATGLAEGDWVGLTVEPVGRPPRTVSGPILMLSLIA